jgi:hypothetical protein
VCSTGNIIPLVQPLNASSIAESIHSLVHPLMKVSSNVVPSNTSVIAVGSNTITLNNSANPGTPAFSSFWFSFPDGVVHHVADLKNITNLPAGTIYTVGNDNSMWMWAKAKDPNNTALYKWVRFICAKWDTDLNNGAITRILADYSPEIGMPSITDINTLIPGCGFRGTEISGGPFEQGLYDMFPWDYPGGFGNEFGYYLGSTDISSDITTNSNNFNSSSLFHNIPTIPLTIDDRGRDIDLISPSMGLTLTDSLAVITVSGNELRQPMHEANNPEELVSVMSRNPVVITVYERSDIDTMSDPSFAFIINNASLHITQTLGSVVRQFITPMEKIQSYVLFSSSINYDICNYSNSNFINNVTLMAPLKWNDTSFTLNNSIDHAWFDPSNPSTDIIDAYQSIRTYKASSTPSLSLSLGIITFALSDANMVGLDLLGLEVNNSIEVKAIRGAGRGRGTIKSYDNTTGIVTVDIENVISTNSATSWRITSLYKNDVSGIVWVDGEKINYWNITTNGTTVIMSKLMRGVNGTYIKDIAPVTAKVFDGMQVPQTSLNPALTLASTVLDLTFILDNSELN